MFPKALNPCVSQIDATTVVKEGRSRFIKLEYENLLFVAQNTTIPVPKVYELRKSEEEDDCLCLYMQYMEGEVIGRKWKQMTPGQRRASMRKVGEFLQQLRDLKQSPPGGWIGSASGKASFDSRIGTASLYGPFPSEAAYNDWRISTFSRFGDMHEPTAHRLQEIRREMPDNHQIVFTHGDISYRNILVKVRGDGDDDVEITAILDWEQAGWRPEFWEKCKTRYAMGTHDFFKVAEEEIYPGYEDELRRESELLLISGPPM